jgi:hypothetical protein
MVDSVEVEMASTAMVPNAKMMVATMGRDQIFIFTLMGTFF